MSIIKKTLKDIQNMPLDNAMFENLKNMPDSSINFEGISDLSDSQIRDGVSFATFLRERRKLKETETHKL